MKKKPAKTPKPSVPPRIHRAVNAVIDYLWDDELESARDFVKEGESLRDHIFESLVVLDNWLHGRSATAASYLKSPAKAHGKTNGQGK